MLVTDEISGVDSGFFDNKQLIVGLIVHQVWELYHRATINVHQYSPTMYENVGFATAFSSGGVVAGFVISTSIQFVSHDNLLLDASAPSVVARV